MVGLKLVEGTRFSDKYRQYPLSWFQNCLLSFWALVAGTPFLWQYSTSLLPVWARRFHDDIVQIRILYGRASWRLFNFVVASSLWRKISSSCNVRLYRTEVHRLCDGIFIVSFFVVRAFGVHNNEQWSVHGCVRWIPMCPRLVCCHTSAPCIGFFHFVAGHRSAYWSCRSRLFTVRAVLWRAPVVVVTPIHTSWRRWCVWGRCFLVCLCQKYPVIFVRNTLSIDAPLRATLTCTVNAWSQTLMNV